MTTPPAIEAGIEAADRAGSLVLASVTALTDEQARGASRLRGWTRGHVLTHLARNADGMRNVIDGAVVGEERAAYPSAESRAADIEAGAHRGPGALVRDFATSHRALLDAWKAAPIGAWDRTGIWLAGGRLPVTVSLTLRRRELLVHGIDLGLTLTPAELPEDYVAEDLDWLREHRTTETWPDAPW
jgi:maleylpyruvate isomerase